jgi:hypothetical protein
MSVRCQPAYCAATVQPCSRNSQPHRLVHTQQACRPFQAARRPAQLHASRRPRLACSAAADGWWRAGEQHWTFVDSSEQLQQVVDGAPNVVLVGPPLLCTLPWAPLQPCIPSAADPQGCGQLQYCVNCFS